MLTFFENKKRLQKYKNLYMLLKREKNIRFSDYQYYQQSSIGILMDNGIIEEDEEGFLQLSNIYEMAVLEDIYTNGVGSLYYYKERASLCKSDRMLTAIHNLESKGWIGYQETLLSDLECDYFDYYLNNSKFVNGPALRNKYLHASIVKQGNDDELHKKNYYTLLMLFSMLTIKINDDLCNRDKYK
jgi:hypothetical protein